MMHGNMQFFFIVSQAAYCEVFTVDVHIILKIKMGFLSQL